MLALREDGDLRDAFAFDEMSRKTMAVQMIGSPMAPFEPRALTDTDVTTVTSYLQNAGLKQVAISNVRAAIDARAIERCYHPVRDYLDGLQWDGIKRVNVWLTTKLGAPQRRTAADHGQAPARHRERRSSNRR
jgi:predicted P-loop ATPase